MIQNFGRSRESTQQRPRENDTVTTQRRDGDGDGDDCNNGYEAMMDRWQVRGCVVGFGPACKTVWLKCGLNVAN